MTAGGVFGGAVMGVPGVGDEVGLGRPRSMVGMSGISSMRLGGGGPPKSARGLVPLSHYSIDEASSIEHQIDVTGDER